MTPVKATIGAILIGCCLMPAAGRAAVLYDNLGAIPDPLAPDFAFAFGPLYDFFSTVSSTTLSDISVLVNASIPSDGGTFTIGVYGDSFTSPGALLQSTTFADSLLGTSPGVFSEAVSVPLSAGTRYWIGISSAPTGSVNWFWSTDISGPGVAGEFYDNQGGVAPNLTGPYQMELTSSAVGAVPEPSSWAMMMVGFAGLVFVGYRTSKQRHRLAARVAQV